MEHSRWDNGEVKADRRQIISVWIFFLKIPERECERKAGGAEGEHLKHTPAKCRAQSLPQDHDLHWDWESDTQLIEPPRCLHANLNFMFYMVEVDVEWEVTGEF